MFENYFKDAKVVGYCIVCREDLQLGNYAYFVDGNGDLLCENIVCLEKYAIENMGFKYGEIDENGEVR